MKTLRLVIVALLAMCGFNSCSNECEHDFIQVDYSNGLVGTWTCLKAGYAEALVIGADGSVVSTGVDGNEYWDNIAGTVKVANNKMSMIFEDGDNFEGRFEMLSGEAFTIFEEDGESFTYRYCGNDLADEVIGMWVCNNAPNAPEKDVIIVTYHEDGTTTYTGAHPFEDGYKVEVTTAYSVIGDLMIHNTGDERMPYIAQRLTYIADGTDLGDVLTNYNPAGTTTSWLRVKQTLELSNMNYNYNSCYISNAKGADKDIKFLNTTFNFAKMDGTIIDKFLRSILFNVHFPNADTLEYTCLLEGNNLVSTAPIEVEGNKVTIKMSSRHKAYNDVVIYTFQDADCSQMHMYMPTSSFENFFSNMSLSILSSSGQVDLNDASAVAGVRQEVVDAIESINLSIVYRAVK